jgi:site-specific DNA-methyltransferase (cytosine-N4-specific)
MSALSLDSTKRKIPDIPNLDHWFAPRVQRAVTDIVDSIGTRRDVTEQEMLKCALSRIIVRISRQESDTRYAAIQKAVSYDDVVSLYSRSVSEVCSTLRNAQLEEGPTVTIMNRDVLDVRSSELGRFDLVITSPPYPNAYEYWLYHKYRMYWLGYDPIAVREREIGARPHYFKKKHQTAEDFERQMRGLFALLRDVTTERAFLCFVISDSIIHGQNIDNKALMTRAAETGGFCLMESTLRNIPYTRKAFNPRVSPRNTEHVLVFRKRSVA